MRGRHFELFAIEHTDFLREFSSEQIADASPLEPHDKPRIRNFIVLFLILKYCSSSKKNVSAIFLLTPGDHLLYSISIEMCGVLLKFPGGL